MKELYIYKQYKHLILTNVLSSGYEYQPIIRKIVCKCAGNTEEKIIKVLYKCVKLLFVQYADDAIIMAGLIPNTYILVAVTLHYAVNCIQTANCLLGSKFCSYIASSTLKWFCLLLC